MTLSATREVLAARAKWRYRGGRRPPFAETPGQRQESVWDYPRPPLMVADRRRIRVSTADRLVAESTTAVRVLETASPPTFYLPPDDVDTSLLRATTRLTPCEWKGVAREYDVAAITGAGWTYSETFPEFADLDGYFSFYPGKLRCTVEGETVKPQPGGYYGGWITAEIVGPFKTGSAANAWW